MTPGVAPPAQRRSARLPPVRPRRRILDALLGLLQVEAVNRLVFRLRFFWLARLRRRLRVHESLEGVIRPEYSIGMLRRGVTSDRPLRLIRPLSVLDALDKRSARVLSVGCRFETELLYLLGYGFRRVRGLDLVAYSPWVDVGNMHGMPYEDDSWDAVILGWVLSYSETPEQAAREIVRVTRNGGVVAVAVAQYPRARLEEFAARGDPMAGADRIQTVEAILSLFDGHVGRVYFSHDAPAAEVESYCGVVFSIRK